jgi:hypothetical protein
MQQSEKTPPHTESKMTSSPEIIPSSMMPNRSSDDSTKTNKHKKDWRFLWLAIITCVGFLSLIGYIALAGNLSDFIFAGSTKKPSATKSMIFAYPLAIQKEVDKSTAHVFVSDDEGKPLPNVVVSLDTNIGLITPDTAITDTTGTAVFEFSSDIAGVAELSPMYKGQKISLPVTIKITD